MSTPDRSRVIRLTYGEAKWFRLEFAGSGMKRIGLRRRGIFLRARNVQIHDHRGGPARRRETVQEISGKEYAQTTSATQLRNL